MTSGNDLAFAISILALGAAGPTYLLAKRVGLIVPLAFIAAYVLAVGAFTYIGEVVFGIDVKFRRMGLLRVWLEISWPALLVGYVPSAISALLACWFSRPSTRRDATALLSVYLFLILGALGTARALDLSHGFWFLVALPSTIFFAIAFAKRVAQGQRH